MIASYIITVAYFSFRCSNKRTERGLKDDDTSPNETKILYLLLQSKLLTKSAALVNFLHSFFSYM